MSAHDQAMKPLTRDLVALVGLLECPGMPLAFVGGALRCFGRWLTMLEDEGSRRQLGRELRAVRLAFEDVLADAEAAS